MRTLPIENYLAAYPTTATVAGVALQALTLARVIMIDALGVDIQGPLSGEDALVAAWVLSGGKVEEWKSGKAPFHHSTIPPFNRFARLMQPRLSEVEKAVRAIRDDAFRCYVKPPKRETNRISNTKTGAGWALDYAEGLCAEYGWSWCEALDTPLSAVFALAAAAIDRYGQRPNGMDYHQRMAAKESKHG